LGTKLDLFWCRAWSGDGLIEVPLDKELPD
jgi:hypothetical protein